MKSQNSTEMHEDYKRRQNRERSDNESSAIVDGDDNGKRNFFLVFIVLTIFAVLFIGPKKSVDFVKIQLSFVLTSQEKSGIITAKNFYGSMEDMETMTHEQLIVLLETDRYGSDDDDIAISALQVIYRKLFVFGNHPDKELQKRLRKVIEDIIDVGKERGDFALELFITKGRSFANCPNSFSNDKINMAAVVRYFLLTLN